MATATLSKSFSSAQSRFIINKKTRVHWGIKDISQGLMLRTISRKAYEYLRKNKILPLPAVSTLRLWIKKFRCRPGLQTSILKIIKQKISSETDPQFAVASLSFDEMHILKEYQYDQRNDQIIGPCQKMQVVVARGIISNWKQQIFFDFDKPMTAVLLKSIVSAAEEHNIHVWSVCCDLGNHGLLNSLGVTPEKPFFQNPCDAERGVYVFPDAPHLLKLLRNHLLDHDFTLSDGTEIYQDWTLKKSWKWTVVSSKFTTSCFQSILLARTAQGKEFDLQLSCYLTPQPQLFVVCFLTRQTWPTGLICLMLGLTF